MTASSLACDNARICCGSNGAMLPLMDVRSCNYLSPYGFCGARVVVMGDGAIASRGEVQRAQRASRCCFDHRHAPRSLPTSFLNCIDVSGGEVGEWVSKSPYARRLFRQRIQAC
jgi:hypothetical protein